MHERECGAERRLSRADVPLATDELARFLIGTMLVRRFEDGSIASGRIVETEAYTADDPASHAFRGATTRNASMFGPNFHAYVYFIYGTAYCLNVSSEACGIGAAVLIRALAPADGIEIMRARRGPSVRDRDLLRGPGRLCLALDIDRRFDGVDLDRDPRLWLASDGVAKPAVGSSIRIGIRRAIEMPHRFYERGSPYISGPRGLSPDV